MFSSHWTSTRQQISADLVHNLSFAVEDWISFMTCRLHQISEVTDRAFLLPLSVDAVVRSCFTEQKTIRWCKAADEDAFASFCFCLWCDRMHVSLINLTLRYRVGLSGRWLCKTNMEGIDILSSDSRLPSSVWRETLGRVRSHITLQLLSSFRLLSRFDLTEIKPDSMWTQ